MAVCPNCGRSLASAAKFCPGCGTKIKETASESARENALVASVEGDGEDSLYDTAIAMIAKVSRLPIIRGDRDEFLRKQFAKSP